MFEKSRLLKRWSLFGLLLFSLLSVFSLNPGSVGNLDLAQTATPAPNTNDTLDADAQAAAALPPIAESTESAADPIPAALSDPNLVNGLSSAVEAAANPAAPLVTASAPTAVATPPAQAAAPSASAATASAAASTPELKDTETGETVLQIRNESISIGGRKVRVRFYQRTDETWYARTRNAMPEGKLCYLCAPSAQVALDLNNQKDDFQSLARALADSIDENLELAKEDADRFGDDHYSDVAYNRRVQRDGYCDSDRRRTDPDCDEYDDYEHDEYGDDFTRDSQRTVSARTAERKFETLSNRCENKEDDEQTRCLVDGYLDVMKCKAVRSSRSSRRSSSRCKIPEEVARDFFNSEIQDRLQEDIMQTEDPGRRSAALRAITKLQGGLKKNQNDIRRQLTAMATKSIFSAAAQAQGHYRNYLNYSKDPKQVTAATQSLGRYQQAMAYADLTYRQMGAMNTTGLSQAVARGLISQNDADQILSSGLLEPGAAVLQGMMASPETYQIPSTISMSTASGTFAANVAGSVSVTPTNFGSFSQSVITNPTGALPTLPDGARRKIYNSSGAVVDAGSINRAQFVPGMSLPMATTQSQRGVVFGPVQPTNGQGLQRN